MNLTGSGQQQVGRRSPEQQFHKQVAIVLDGLVQSAPEIQPDDTRSRRSTAPRRSPGNFTQDEAEDLAKLINYGALPVQLKQLNVENVSPTLGKRPAQRRHRSPASSASRWSRSTCSSSTGCSASW